METTTESKIIQGQISDRISFLNFVSALSVIHILTPYSLKWVLTPLNGCSTHREILLNQTEIRLYLPFSDWFGTKRTVSHFELRTVVLVVVPEHDQIWKLSKPLDAMAVRKYLRSQTFQNYVCWWKISSQTLQYKTILLNILLYLLILVDYSLFLTYGWIT